MSFWATPIPLHPLLCSALVEREIPHHANIGDESYICSMDRDFGDELAPNQQNLVNRSCSVADKKSQLDLRMLLLKLNGLRLQVEGYWYSPGFREESLKTLNVSRPLLLKVLKLGLERCLENGSSGLQGTIEVALQWLQ